jgi:hypothetical protein
MRQQLQIIPLTCELTTPQSGANLLLLSLKLATNRSNSCIAANALT